MANDQLCSILYDKLLLSHNSCVDHSNVHDDCRHDDDDGDENVYNNEDEL